MKLCACGCEEEVTSLRPNKYINSRGEVRPAGELCDYVFGHGRRGKFGHRSAGSPATEVPSNVDIAWAAGFYEGEGSCTRLSEIRITQKDGEVLQRLQRWFGGNITVQIQKGVEYPIWRATGARARGIRLTLYPFLSSRRQGQIRQNLKLGVVI